MVIVALRLLVEALAATDTGHRSPLLLPLVGETVAQVWFDPAVQLVFEVTVNGVALRRRIHRVRGRTDRRRRRGAVLGEGCASARRW